MYKIAIIEQIHQDGLAILENHPKFNYEIIEDTSEKNLIEKLPNFDACTLRVSKLDEKILKHCKKIKVISRHGVGYDNVDLNYIKNNNIAFIGGGPASVELALGLQKRFKNTNGH